MFRRARHYGHNVPLRSFENRALISLAKSVDSGEDSVVIKFSTPLEPKISRGNKGLLSNSNAVGL